MVCRIVELRHKEVINSSDGCRIGYVDDVEVDTVTSQVRAVIVFGRPRLFGLLGRNDDVIIPWSDIQLIGEATILVSCNMKFHQKKNRIPKSFV